jgi:hypothetical protein
MENELYHWGIKKGEAAEKHKYVKREWKNNRWVYYYDTPGAKNKPAVQKPKVERKPVSKPEIKKPVKASQTVNKGISTVKSIFSTPVNSSTSKNAEAVKKRMTEAKQLVESKILNKKDDYKDLSISGAVMRNDPSVIKKEDNKPLENQHQAETGKEDIVIDKARNKQSAIDKKKAEADKRNEEFKKRNEERKAKLESERKAKKEAEEAEKKALEEKAKKEYESAQNAERNSIRKTELAEALEKLNTKPTWFKTYNPLPELDLKTEATTLDEDMRAINPKFSSDKDNLYNQNCAVCTLAYDLRRRGYDVMAASEEVTMGDGSAGLTIREIQKCYKGGTFVTMNDLARNNKEISGEIKDAISSEDGVRLGKAVDKELLSYGEGARGHVVFYWTAGSAHDIVWEVEKGKVVYRDCQTNKKIELEKYSSLSKDIDYMRTDNLELTDEAMKYIRNRKDGQ